MDLYDGSFDPGQKVLLIGGGLAGSEAAVELAMAGREVVLIEIESDIARDANNVHRPALLREIRRRSDQITVMTDTRCTRIKKDGVTCLTKTGDTVDIGGDSVVLAVGMRGRTAEALALGAAAREYKWVGDCRKSRQIGNAVLEGYDAAMDI